MTVSINPSTHRPARVTRDPATADQSHHDALATMTAALKALQADIEENDMPPVALVPRSDRYVAHLRRLRIVPAPSQGFYDINLLTGEVAFGVPMLAILSGLDETTLTRFTELFLLHETLHVDQGMYSSTHRGIGHASVVLEEMDYIADAFAMATAIQRGLRMRPGDDAQGVIREYARIAFQGLELFDRSEAPDSMDSIGEARLRRYLIWLVQYVRMLPAQTLADVHATLFPRITVELEPMQVKLLEDGERSFEAATEHTQFFAARAGQLARQAATDGFSPAEMFQAILRYDFETAMEQIRYVVMQYHQVLVPQL